MEPTDNLVTDTIRRTVKIDLTIAGAADTDTVTIIGAALVVASNTYFEYGHPGKLRDCILRRLVDLPVIGFPSHLNVRAPRLLYIVTSCPKKIFQTSSVCADDGSKLTYCVVCWVLRHLAIDRMNVSATTKALGVSWDLVNQVAFDACCQLVYDDPHHLDGAHILGVNEHVWKYTRKPGQPPNLAAILVDPTPLVDGRGPA